MSAVIADLLTAVVIPPLSSGTATLVLHSPRSAFYCGWVLSAIVGAVGLAIDHEPWWWIATAAANALLGAYLWWRKRKRRKRAPRAYGAKSRALVQALVDRAREQARPRRVLRPLPNPG